MKGKFKVTKQSLVDWQVTDIHGHHIAWIHKVSLGYNVSIKEYHNGEPCFCVNFKEAKAFAIT